MSTFEEVLVVIFLKSQKLAVYDLIWEALLFPVCWKRLEGF